MTKEIKRHPVFPEGTPTQFSKNKKKEDAMTTWYKEIRK